MDNLNNNEKIKSSVDSKLHEIEERLRMLHEKRMTSNLEQKNELLKKGLSNTQEAVKDLNENISKLKSKAETTNAGQNTDLHKKMFESFYKGQEEKPESTSEITDDSIVESQKKEDKVEKLETKVIKNQTAPHGAIILRPKEKRAGLFNDENLTEDYELGYRFHQLGFKTGFFNVKVDPADESSRIATAEFFPNSFWGSVKQRSRWVAGIVFQNWKSHKWSGNLAMKYFLFRDRKSIFSFFGAALSNIVILYFIYAILSRIFNWPFAYSLVGHSSVLWYLMIANLIFMISRLSHRFVFTYNWYGLKYAFFSMFRLPVDTFVNTFAIARSVNVYRKNKKKAVWDSTKHY